MNEHETKLAELQTFVEKVAYLLGCDVGFDSDALDGIVECLQDALARAEYLESSPGAQIESALRQVMRESLSERECLF